jgi:hypothetical protein
MMSMDITLIHVHDAAASRLHYELTYTIPIGPPLRIVCVDNDSPESVASDAPYFDVY